MRHDFARILAWIQAGEEVAITMRRQAVARLVPWPETKAARRPMPDLATRLKKVFGTKIIADKSMKAVRDQNRGTI